MSAQNKALMRRLFDEVWNEGNLDKLDDARNIGQLLTK
jgi:hypothetical protein